MIVGTVCVLVLGVVALWQLRRASHWKLVSRLLGHDYAIEIAKRRALATALGDLEAGLRSGDAILCAQAMDAALRVARDDTDATLRKLGFELPARPS